MHYPSYRPDIDGLRAIAVLLVVFHHAFPKLFPSGFIGVDLFFVISGFLITTIIFKSLKHGNFSFLDFYARRIKRIFPALGLVLVACLAYGWLTLLPTDYKQLGKHTLAGAAFVSNFVLWNESGYFNGDSRLKPLLHLWSLGIEEQYYILWPLLAWIAYKKKLNLFKVCLALLVLSFVLNIVFVNYNTVAAFFSPASRFWELLVGSMLAYVTMQRQESMVSKDDVTQNNQKAWGGFILLSVGLIFINPERSFPGFWALLPTLGAYLIIDAGERAWINRVILSNRYLVWVGLISFPLYLWHWPLLVFATLRTIDLIPSDSLVFGMIALSVVLAGLTYRLVERPIRLGKRFGSSKTILLALLLSVIAYSGFNIYKREGLIFRIPQNLQKIATFKYDYAVDSNFECLIGSTEKDIEINKSCFHKSDKLNNSILLWGDSYAWAMYAGINKLAAPQDKVYLMSKAGCPPIFEVERTYVKHCSTHNERVKSAIDTEKYDQVVLIARWDHWSYQSEKYLASISNTIEKLKLMGVKRIHVIGPPPEWHPSLFEVLIKHALRDTFEHKLQNRISEGVTTSTALDQQLKQLTVEKDVAFISLLDILCNKDGCITKIGPNPEDLVGYDDGHLSKKGGEFVAKQFPNAFFKPTP